MTAPAVRAVAIVLSVAALAWGTVGPCSAATKPDPRFKVAPAELLATLRTIGVVPSVVPNDVPDAEQVAQRLDSEVVSWLTSAGYQVVPPAEMRAIRARASAAMGGVYDPLTGRAVKEKLAALDEFTNVEFTVKHRVDALLRIAVVTRRARFLGGVAGWDGVHESSTGQTGVSGLMVGLGSAGKLPALSLAVQLTEVQGNALYASLGGLQLLGYVDRSGRNGAFGQRSVDPKFIMDDPVRDERALALALDPLRRTRAAASGAESAPTPTRLPPPAPVQKLARKEFLSRYRRVALVPVDAPDIEQHDRLQLRYRELLVSRLSQLGFDVVVDDNYNRAWTDERARVGGFHDPFTGRLDVGKVKASQASVFGAMGERLAASAFVLPAVEVRSARYSGGTAEWDGTRESVVREGVFESLGTFEVYFFGELDARSLAVRIVDAKGELLFEGAGGIQLAEKLAGYRPVALPEPDLFADPARDVRAVALALRALEPPPPESP